MARFDLAVPGDIRFGAGRVSEVPGLLADLGASRVLILTGRTTSRADETRSALNEADISSVVFGVATEPSVERVRAGLDLLLDQVPPHVQALPAYSLANQEPHEE